MNTKTIDENKRDFYEKHGHEFILDGHWLYYPDGTRREGGTFGVVIEPPDDPYERALAIKKYWEVRLSHAVKKFQKLRDSLRARARNELLSSTPGPPPSRDELEELKKLRAEVKKLQDTLEMAESECEKLKPQPRKDFEQRSERNRAECQSFLEATGKVEV